MSEAHLCSLMCVFDARVNVKKKKKVRLFLFNCGTKHILKTMTVDDPSSFSIFKSFCYGWHRRKTAFTILCQISDSFILAFGLNRNA